MAHGLVRRESVETEMQKSEENKKTFVYTKKRGYDVTRNPHLNKVSLRARLCKVFILFLWTRLSSEPMPSGAVGNGSDDR